MALTIEDGTGVAAADSFVTLAEFEAYVEAYVTQTTMGGHGHDDSHEMNLRRAAQWLEKQNWRGYRQYQAQGLSWPRLDMGYVDGWPINGDTIPQDIKDAQCEMAYLLHEGADPFATVTGGAVKVSRVKAGPVDSETEYANTREIPRFTALEGKIAPYLASGSAYGQVRLLRG